MRGVTPELLFGMDTNRNGMVDAHEEQATLDGSAVNSGNGSFDYFEFSGMLDRGWSAYLTLYSAERNADSTGYPRTHVNGEDMEQLYDDLTAVMEAHRSSGCRATLVLAPERKKYSVIEVARDARVISLAGKPAVDADQVAGRYLFTGCHIIDEEILEYEAVYPPEEVFNSLHWLEPLGDFLEVYDRIWTEITSQ